MTQGARYVVGIDLGTTNTVAAYALLRKAGRPSVELLPIPQMVAMGEVAEAETLPSARYHAAAGELSKETVALSSTDVTGEGIEHVVVGALAQSLGAKVPGRLVTSAKSWLSHAAVDRFAKILPWGASEDVPKTSPVDASASYLRRVKRAWDERFPQDPLEAQDIILTVPASFDEGARALTLEAAKRAGLTKLKLVEEPQAALHSFLDIHQEAIEAELEGVRLAVVVDVGGGTTDLTLVRVEPRESGVRLTRIAVGDHLMLGGDNMDLALAHHVEQKLGGTALSASRFGELVAQCRAAKEKLLGEDAPESVRITLLGGGSRLIGGSITAELTREEAHALVLDGFFPACGAEERAQRRRAALVDLGLPYAADAGITRHLAEFLARHETLAREALGEHAPAAGAVIPDAVLLNGGVFNGSALRERLVRVISAWRGADVRVLTGTDPDLAVARGAAAFGLARHGHGQRIHGGSARSYFLHVGERDGVKRGVCILPRGAEEGEAIALPKQGLSLKLGRPVRFHVYATTADVAYVAAGDVVSLADEERYVELPQLAAVLGDATEAAREVPVALVTCLTEIGTLEIACVEKERDRRFKLELELRKSGGEAGEVQRITNLHPRFREATALIAGVYGKPKEGADPRDVKRLRADLERVLGPREQWDTPLLRELFSALLAGMKNRRRTDDHERVWLNLTGYCLRPGFGYPLDAWRVQQVFPAFTQDVQFVNEPQNWAELWTMLRRVAGGLDAAMQTQVLDAIEWYLEPPSPRARPRPKGVKKLGVDEMIALASVLEHVPAERKARIGAFFVERIEKHGAPAQTWWALGRLGARVPFHGSAHNVVSPDVAATWVTAAMRQDFQKVQQAAFAATTIARRSGDRVRDLPMELAQRLAEKLTREGMSPAWAKMVLEVTHLEAADEKRVFGESLPPGLRLLD